MKKFPKIVLLMILVAMAALALISCTGEEGNIVHEAEFTLVKPSEIGTRDYWELAKTFNELSTQFIEAVYSGDQEKINQLVRPELIESVVEKPQEVTHIKQQAIIYADGRYNCIVQIGTEKEDAFRSLHIFFENEGEQWIICDVQRDA